MTLSRRTFVEGKRYETVLFQENTHPGDFEMVEFQDYQNREREAMAQNLIVDGFFADSFKIVGSGLSNAVNVTPGPGGYSLGHRLILPDAIHPLISGQYVYNMAIAVPATNRTDLVYIDIFIESVNATMDPDIQDPFLGPSALRERVRYNFGVAQNVTSTTVPTLPVGHVGLPLALITRRAGDPAINLADVVDVRTLCSLNPQFKAKNTIVVSPAGGDFNDPTSALTSIQGLTSSSNQYTILIRPGVYTIAKPLTFTDPYVSMIGTDPDACVIKGNFTGLSTALIGADHISLRNLTLDYASGSGAHAAVVFFTGNFIASLDNLVLGPFYYGENAINAFNGIDMVAGGTVSIRHCQVFTQNMGAASAIAVGSATVADIQDCSVTAAVSDTLNVANGAALTLSKCTFVGTRSLLVSAGNMVARGCSWTNQALKSFPITGDPTLTLTTGVVNTMVDCLIDSGGGSGLASRVDTTAIWTNVVINSQFSTSGGGNSVYKNVQFLLGLDINGTASTLVDCSFPIAPGSWAIGGSSGEALVIRGTTTPILVDCVFDAGKCVLVLGGSPKFRGCRLTSASSSARVINILSTSSDVLFDSCTVQLTASYATSPVFIGGSGGSGRFTWTHNHMEGSAAGQPDYVLRGSGGTGASLFAGSNTSTAGALREPTTITTFSNIEQAP